MFAYPAVSVGVLHARCDNYFLIVILHGYSQFPNDLADSDHRNLVAWLIWLSAVQKTLYPHLEAENFEFV